MVSCRVRPTHQIKWLFTKARFIYHIYSITTPILWIKPIFHKPVKRRIQPIWNFPHISMLYRIPMDIVRMPLKVYIIPDQMFPNLSWVHRRDRVARLWISFRFLSRFIQYRRTHNAAIAIFSYAPLYDCLSGWEIRIFLRQAPNTNEDDQATIPMLKFWMATFVLLCLYLLVMPALLTRLSKFVYEGRCWR